MPQRSLELSEQQKACLRLVAQGFTSKQIAKMLGMSPLTVDDYIKKAMSRLQVGSRRDAARMLAEAENDLPQSLGPPSQPVVLEDDSPPDEGTAGDHPTGRSQRFLPIGGRLNDLTYSGRLLGTAAITFIASLLLILTLVIILGVIHLLR